MRFFKQQSFHYRSLARIIGHTDTIIAALSVLAVLVRAIIVTLHPVTTIPSADHTFRAIFVQNNHTNNTLVLGVPMTTYIWISAVGDILAAILQFWAGMALVGSATEGCNPRIALYKGYFWFFVSSLILCCYACWRVAERNFIDAVTGFTVRGAFLLIISKFIQEIKHKECYSEDIRVKRTRVRSVFAIDGKDLCGANTTGNWMKSVITT